MICFAGRSPVKLSPTSAFLSVVFVSLLSIRLLAQVAPGVQEIDRTRLNEQVTAYETAPNTAVIIVHTFAEEKPVSLDRSARVDLTNLGNHLGVFLTVPGRDSAVFTNTALGRYTISVTAVGYMSASQTISVLSPEKRDVEIVLHRDPGAVTLNEATGVLSQKAKKEANRAVSLLKSGDLTHAEKHLKTAYVSAPSSADLNFLLGYLYFQKNDYAQAGIYLGMAASLSPHSAQTLTLLGRTKLAVQNYPEAQSALEQAILVDSEEWLAHDLLANTYLEQKEFSKALDEARVAVAKSARHGKDASAAAQLTLGQALIAVGQKTEGIQALRVYLDASPPKNMIEPVHALITGAQESNQKRAAGSEITTSPDPLIRPTLEPGVTCPCAQVLAKTGQRVQELVQDITRFTAEENLLHKSLDGVGLSNHAETRQYNYAAAISSRPGSVSIEDYSEDRVPQAGSPDRIGSTGFVMLALVFHPEMRSDFDFDCEGQGRWLGKLTWLVHFRQRPDRPNRMQDYNLSGKIYRIDLKGRAWISSDTSQIVHIEADMVNPMHEIQMLSEHQAVEYGPVPFARKSTMLWLPKNVEIYFDFGKHHYYRHYTFDNYMLFDVDASEKVNLPPDTALSGPTSSTQRNPD
jgi:tetratricopeptide (TPR) repeat protein